MTAVLYGAGPWPWDGTGGSPRIPHVTDDGVKELVGGLFRQEDLARQIRELREAVDLLRQGKGEVTSLVMVRKMIEAMIAADPLALAEIEKVCAEARSGK